MQDQGLNRVLALYLDFNRSNSVNCEAVGYLNI